ncbi:hypothetical protein GCM10010103_76630 [Streptomyces paradoxus]|uniref:Peptidase inhibitor family I36 n=1 Tax=Streptomyces paradoxus TaxID=66375 RepID=A0A7W9WL94_9ACTN|nr:hypothetical protein [Streptomyces paradoxus]MBB6081124.1 hypothetical protein [Streptomyces paradoxus]
MRNKLRNLLAVAAVAAATGTTVLMGATGASAAAQADWAGCPDGNVCIYAEGRYSNIGAGDITNKYFRYATYNLSNQVNQHWVLNNQNGPFEDAYVKLCTGYNGTGDCSKVLGPGYGEYLNLTPINSIVLYR